MQDDMSQGVNAPFQSVSLEDEAYLLVSKPKQTRLQSSNCIWRIPSRKLTKNEVFLENEVFCKIALCELKCRKEDSGVTRKVDNEVPSAKANQ